MTGDTPYDRHTHTQNYPYDTPSTLLILHIHLYPFQCCLRRLRKNIHSGNEVKMKWIGTKLVSSYSYLPSTFQRFDLNRISVTDDGKHPPSPSDGSLDNRNESQRLRYYRLHTLAAIREPKTRHRHHVLDITYTAIWHVNTGCSTNTAHPHTMLHFHLCALTKKNRLIIITIMRREIRCRKCAEMLISVLNPRYLSKKYVVPESKPQRRLPL